MNVAAILHNTKLERWHPIIFKMAPMPGGVEVGRYKSVGHHPHGFGTRQEAILSIREDIVPRSGIPTKEFIDDGDFAWDGEKIPAMVVFFLERDGKLQCILC